MAVLAMCMAVIMHTAWVHAVSIHTGIIQDFILPAV